MVKCAAINCRSGYRPTNKEREMIKRGETPPCKKHVFTFPQKAEIRAQWVAAIHREDSGWNPRHSGICELHFKPQDFVAGFASRTKKIRQRLRLKPDVIPSVIDRHPETTRPAVVEELSTNRARVCSSENVNNIITGNTGDTHGENDISINGLDDNFFSKGYAAATAVECDVFFTEGESLDNGLTTHTSCTTRDPMMVETAYSPMSPSLAAGRGVFTTEGKSHDNELSLHPSSSTLDQIVVDRAYSPLSPSGPLLPAGQHQHHMNLLFHEMIQAHRNAWQAQITALQARENYYLCKSK